ncbi:hypothetical protein D3C77_395260 [compost metagenome]
MYLRNVLEKFSSHFYCHFQHVRYALVLVFHLERFTVVSLSFTYFTRHVNIRQEVHFNLDNPVPPAGLAAPSLNVKAKAAFLIAANFRFRGLREKIANIVKYARISCWVRTRRPANRGLVDIDDLLYMLQAFNLTVLPRTHLRPIQIAGQRFI